MLYIAPPNPELPYITTFVNTGCPDSIRMTEPAPAELLLTKIRFRNLGEASNTRMAPPPSGAVPFFMVNPSTIDNESSPVLNSIPV